MKFLKPSINWLFLFIPITVVLEHAGGVPAPLIFFSAAFAIIPIARLIVEATEQISTRTGDAIGGLLNATFGNAPELIIAVVALKAGLFDMVRASLIGAILANLLLAMGVAFLLGGMRYHDRVNDRQAAHELLTKARNSLYRGATSDGNYIVDMVDRRGRALRQILCLNSGNAGIGAEQKEWLKRINQISPQKGKVPPRLAAFHIPLKQYDDIWETGFARGIKYEKVCSEKENGSSLAILKNAGVHACFCGHDHVNDYTGVIDGVELTYGRTTGVGGYDAMQVPNGGKLYILNGRTGKYSWKSVLLNGKQ